MEKEQGLLIIGIPRAIVKNHATRSIVFLFNYMVVSVNPSRSHLLNSCYLLGTVQKGDQKAIYIFNSFRSLGTLILQVLPASSWLQVIKLLSLSFIPPLYILLCESEAEPLSHIFSLLVGSPWGFANRGEELKVRKQEDLLLPIWFFLKIYILFNYLLLDRG